MKKELELSELQEIGLDILKEVHHFCEKNGIRYSLAYGTLIGAVRHHGFIPWDDDIDVIMPRNDYDKFCRSFISDKYIVSSVINDPNCRITFARVCDTKYTITESIMPWNLKSLGCWIDVFPIDGAEDDFSFYSKRFTEIDKSFQRIQHYRGALLSFASVPRVSSFSRLLMKKVVYCNGFFIPKLIKQVNQMANTIPFGTTSSWGLLAFNSYGLKDYHSIDLIKEFTEINFEGYSFWALNGFDKYLRNIYDNYLELPPIEQRVPKHGFVHYYWR